MPCNCENGHTTDNINKTPVHCVKCMHCPNTNCINGNKINGNADTEDYTKILRYSKTNKIKYMVETELN